MARAGQIVYVAQYDHMDDVVEVSSARVLRKHGATDVVLDGRESGWGYRKRVPLKECYPSEKRAVEALRLVLADRAEKIERELRVLDAALSRLAEAAESSRKAGVTE